MKTTELTKRIYDKYPKVWEELEDKYNHESIDDVGFISYFFKDYFISLINYTSNQVALIPFSMLYGILEDFFEENGIFIEIRLLRDFSENKISYYFNVYNLKSLEFITNSEKFKSKTEAKHQAILKACEILEAVNE